jgi:hypothetical protein
VLSAIDTVRKKLQGYQEYYIIAVVDNMVMDYYYYYYYYFYKTHLRNSPSSKIHGRLGHMKSKMLFLAAALAQHLADKN